MKVRISELQNQLCFYVMQRIFLCFYGMYLYQIHVQSKSIAIFANIKLFSYKFQSVLQQIHSFTVFQVLHALIGVL